MNGVRRQTKLAAKSPLIVGVEWQERLTGSQQLCLLNEINGEMEMAPYWDRNEKGKKVITECRLCGEQIKRKTYGNLPEGDVLIESNFISLSQFDALDVGQT